MRSLSYQAFVAATALLLAGCEAEAGELAITASERQDSDLASAATGLSDTDQAAAYRAAGFRQVDGQWRSGCDDPGTLSYSPGEIAQSGDFNEDGLPDAVIVEGGTYCYGFVGRGYFLVSKQPDGWRLMDSRGGFANLLDTRGSGNPDVEVGGPGFCFPVLRWNGSEYVLNRRQYEGKPCTG